MLSTWCCVGERQSWAAPSVPNVKIVDNSDLLKSKPYGTFKPQLNYNTLDKKSRTDDSEEVTPNDVASADKTTKDLDVDLNADDEITEAGSRTMSDSDTDS